MQDLNWGEVPTQRKRKEEKYSFPVVTMSAIEKVGAGRKFSFNKAAQEALGIKGGDKIAFAFPADGIFVRKFESERALTLTQTCSISDKKTYEFIAKQLNLNIEEENELLLTPSTMGEGIFQLTVLLQPMTFSNTELGEVSDEADLDADLSSIPETPEGGPLYKMVDESTEASDEMVTEAIEEVAEVNEPEAEDAVVEEAVEEDTTEEESDEDDEEEEW
jgi:hypothetical protein